MKSKVAILLWAFFSISLNSCSKVVDSFVFSIVSPVNNWQYYEDNPIWFASNVNTENVEWFSSIDGYLGSGNGLFVFLSSGLHTITCQIDKYVSTISILVEKKEIFDDQILVYKVLSDNRDVLLYEGIYSPVLISSDSGGNGVHAETKGRASILRDIPVKRINDIASVPITKSSARTVSSHYVGERKTFNVVKTNNQLDVPHEILFELKDIREHCTVWIADNTYYDENAVEACISNFENIIYPRLITIWGTWADIDDDGKIAFLFCPTINEEQSVIGFFNPDDLFSLENNEYSNQMDVLYLALPYSTVFTGNYSIESISATIAHELTHAITFNIKTYQRVLNDFSNAPQEESFLDEGLSHLSESLCGFGESGGNMAFINAYLKQPELYSFSEKNAFGQNDSPGKRGAMAYFLSWLFWKYGGMYWDSSNGISVCDSGGITFLHRLIASNEIGWNNISTTCGKNAVELLKLFAIDVQKENKGLLPYYPAIDPVTGECVEIVCNLPQYGIIPLVATYNVEDSISVLPWSIVFYKPLQITERNVIKLQVNNPKSVLYWVFLKT